MDERTSPALSALQAEAELTPLEVSKTTSVVFTGAYNTGKSTLIKRLLVEYGQSVPGWLTISAAPETIDVDGVEISDGITLVDTPGLKSGHAVHEEALVSAVRSADVMVLVLGLNLLTSEKEEILGLIQGRQVRPQGWPWPDHALQVVLAKLDMGGIDPTVDPVAFGQFAAAKEREFLDVCKAGGIEHPPPTQVVIADYKAEVGAGKVENVDYLAADWDGVAAFRSILESLDHETLREATLIRRTVTDAAEKAAALLEAQQALSGTKEAFELRQAKLEAAITSRHLRMESAVVDLNERLDHYAEKAFFSPESDSPVSDDELRSVIDEWLDQQRNWVAGDDDQSNIQTVDGSVGSGSEDSSPWRFIEVLMDASGPISEAAVGFVAARFSAAQIDIRAEIREAKNTGNAYFTDPDRMFPDAKSLKWADGILLAVDVLPLALEVAKLYKNLSGPSTPEHEEAKRELRTKVVSRNEEATEVGRQMLAHVIKESDAAIREEIVELKRVLDVTVSSAEADGAWADRIEQAIEMVRETLPRS